LLRRLQQGLHAVEQSLLCEGLLDLAVRGGAMIHDSQSTQAGVFLAQFRENRIHIRTCGNQHINGPFVNLPQRDGFLRIGGLDQVVPVRLKEIVEQRANPFAAVDQ